MTPDTIRALAQIRQDFYSLFESLMDVPVKVTNRNSYASNLSIASWVDSQQRLNYICIFANTAPDDLVPERPFTLRLAVNQGGDTFVITRHKKGGQELNRGWAIALTLLPDEILDFLPWLVKLIRSGDISANAPLPAPPYPLDDMAAPLTLRALQSHPIKTQEASRQLSRSLIAQPG